MNRQVVRTAGMLVLLLAVSACGLRTMSPGAMSQFDSDAYATLIVTQQLIESSKEALAAGDLPEGVREPLNILIDSYNATRSLWLLYRGGEENIEGRITVALDTVNQAVANLRSASR